MTRQATTLAGAHLRRLHRVKQRSSAPAPALGQEMLAFFRNSVQKRQTKLGVIGQSWQRLVPEILLEHCALESFHGGTLRVIVDSAPHLYDLKQLLLAGLEKQLALACKSAGLRRVALKRGRWYEGAGPDRKITF